MLSPKWRAVIYNRIRISRALKKCPFQTDHLNEVFTEVQFSLYQSNHGFRTMEFRRHANSQTWHFSRRCSHWPGDSFNIIIADKLPADFPLCKECIALNAQEVSRTKG